MSNTDKAILASLMFTMVSVAVIVLWVDIEQDKMEQRIQEVYALEMEQIERTKKIVGIIDEQREDIEYIEDRIDGIDVRLDNHMDILFRLQMQRVMDSKITPTPTPVPTKALNVNVTEADIRNISALVYLECGSCSYKCQKAVASVIFNRMMLYHKTANQVIYERGVFSPASRVKSTRPSASCVRAVREVLATGTTLPLRVVAFRNGHYHSFGTNYCHIDNVYFTKI